jgi:hypothetical protein
VADEPKDDKPEVAPLPGARTGTLIGTGIEPPADRTGTLLGLGIPEEGPAPVAAQPGAPAPIPLTLDRARRLDDALDGKRAIVVLGVTALTCAVSIAEWALDRPPIFTLILTFLSIVALELIALARLGALRDDNGQWSLGLAWVRVGAAMAELKATLASLHVFGMIATATCLAALIARNGGIALARTLSLFGVDIAPTLERVTGAPLFAVAGALLVGGLLWVLGLRKVP